MRLFKEYLRIAIMGIVLSVLLFAQGIAEADKLGLSFDNYGFYAFDKKAESAKRRNVFEDWMTARLTFWKLEANVTGEAHLPPPGWSPDTNGFGLYERSLTYADHGFSVTAGNFYALLGKGITLKSLRNKDLRYNSNIDGLRFQYANNVIDITALSGSPRDFTGRRFSRVDGGEIRLTPVTWGFAGGTFAQAETPEGDPLQLVSGYLQLQKSSGNIYAELASRDIGKGSKDFDRNLFNAQGTAFYCTANAFSGDFTTMFETAYYRNFDLSEFVVNSQNLSDTLWMLNNPPPGWQEHSSSLMGRVQPVLIANNHASVHGEITYAFSDENNVSLSASRARGVKSNETGGSDAISNVLNFMDYSADYSDIFGKGEIVFPAEIDWTVGAGMQRTSEADYYNVIVSNDIGLLDRYSIQSGFEHQVVGLSINQKIYYNQIYSLTFSSSAPRLSLGLIGEFHGEAGETAESKNTVSKWLGTQINWTYYKTNECILFIGNRKAGKICSGGVCVYKPDFSGVELIMVFRF